MDAPTKRYLREFIYSMIAYVYAIPSIIAVNSLREYPFTPARMIVALTPVAPVAFMVYFFIRYLGSIDELQQRIQLLSMSSCWDDRPVDLLLRLPGKRGVSAHLAVVGLSAHDPAVGTGPGLYFTEIRMKNKLKVCCAPNGTGPRPTWRSGWTSRGRRSTPSRPEKYDPSLPLAFKIAEVFRRQSRRFLCTRNIPPALRYCPQIPKNGICRVRSSSYFWMKMPRWLATEASLAVCSCRWANSRERVPLPLPWMTIAEELLLSMLIASYAP